MHPLSLGTSDFVALRRNRMIYADKTDLIYSLASTRARIFLARPRHFGKSLLVSTLQSLFSDGLKYFSGLQIEKRWTDRQYDVVRLDFSGLKIFDNLDQFERDFKSVLLEAFLPLGFNVDNRRENIVFFDQFKSWLLTLPPDSLVLLIDEYDTPLTSHLDDDEAFDVIRNHLDKFYTVLKSAERCLRFFFMTGITQLSSTSIFSAFNNLTDISLDTKYSQLLGLTEQEISLHFEDYLASAEKVLRLNRDQLRNALRENYDGFCFDRKAQNHIYCPWSFLNFLNNPEEGFLNYWYASGGQPKVLLNYLKKHKLANPFAFDEPRQIRLSELTAAREYKDIGIEALLAQAGYLTIRSVRSNGYAELGYPNKEVELSMAQLYTDELLRGKNLDPMGVPMLSELIETGSLEEIVARFNAGINLIDYQNFPITTEAASRACIQLFLMGAALMPEVEKHTALGRSDLEVRAGKRHWVFEFKYAAKTKAAAELLEAGREQMLSRRYGMGPGAGELHRAVLVFCGETRRFERWLEI